MRWRCGDEVFSELTRGDHSATHDASDAADDAADADAAAAAHSTRDQPSIAAVVIRPCRAYRREVSSSSLVPRDNSRNELEGPKN